MENWTIRHRIFTKESFILYYRLFGDLEYDVHLRKYSRYFLMESEQKNLNLILKSKDVCVKVVFSRVLLLL